MTHEQETSKQTLRRRLHSTSPTRLNFATGWHPGNMRKPKQNEGSLFGLQGVQTHNGQEQSFGVFVIADGVSHHERGQEASRLAVRVMSNTLVPSLLGDAEIGEETLMALLSESVQRANEVIYQWNQQGQAAMETMMTAVVVVGANAYIANVGESCTYLYRQSSGLYQVTRDHSSGAYLLEAETTTTLDATRTTYPERNHIYRSIGSSSLVEVDLFPVPLHMDDILLLCSDSIWKVIYPADIQHILNASQSGPSQIVSALIETALTRGGTDAMSSIVVSLSDKEGERYS
ncbi:MAG: hypothetical protein NVS4B11_13280 [Ktedonobacteraceae bacterium]